MVSELSVASTRSHHSGGGGSTSRDPEGCFFPMAAEVGRRRRWVDVDGVDGQLGVEFRRQL